jgi:myo-inositol-1(or 4)-monophosphatase
MADKTMLEIAVSCARHAGEILLRNLEKPRHIEHKESQDTNLVTETDTEVEEFLIGVIRREFPNHDILAEESGSHGLTSEYRWIIDPLDGTTNYAHRMPLFCTSIGLERRGEIILGVIYDPTRDELYTAEKGRGAFLNGRRLQVSDTDKLGESLLVTGFPYDVRSNPDHVVQHFAAFLMEARALRRLGSAAIDCCYVAAGRFDGFWESSLNPWDMAAGVLMVLEAGGKFFFNDTATTEIYTRAMVVSNGKIHDQIIDVLGRSLNVE